MKLSKLYCIVSNRKRRKFKIAIWCIQIIATCINQTGKLGDFRRDLGGATAVKSKGKGKKSDPGRAQGLQGAQKRMLQCTCQMNIDI